MALLQGSNVNRGMQRRLASKQANEVLPAALVAAKLKCSGARPMDRAKKGPLALLAAQV
jgi:hypothetical protein